MTVALVQRVKWAAELPGLSRAVWGEVNPACREGK